MSVTSALPNPAGEATPFMGLAPLARAAFLDTDLGPVKARLLERLAQDENDANALMDLSIVLQLMGQRDLGLTAQTMALALRQCYRIAGSAAGPGMRLLAFLVPGDLTENNALEFLLEHTDVTLHLLYVSPDLPLPAHVPDHDLAIVAACETDRNRPLLRHIEKLVRSWPKQVLCSPGRIARLSRDGACHLLQSVPGLVMPVTRRIHRDTLAAGNHRAFPLIIRPVDSQKGYGLKKLDEPADIGDYLKGPPEAEFYAAPYIDYRGPGGKFRKYRIVLIDGRPYACHMALSDNWVVHYMSAGMLEDTAKRAEEANFFATFDDDFARRHQSALTAIGERLELEYVGIDCGETPARELLIFEVDSGMTVHSMDPVEIFPYKQPQMRKVFGAFRQMLIDRSAIHS